MPGEVGTVQLQRSADPCSGQLQCAHRDEAVPGMQIPADLDAERLDRRAVSVLHSGAVQVDRAPDLSVAQVDAAAHDHTLAGLEVAVDDRANQSQRGLTAPGAAAGQSRLLDVERAPNGCPVKVDRPLVDEAAIEVEAAPDDELGCAEARFRAEQPRAAEAEVLLNARAVEVDGAPAVQPGGGHSLLHTERLRVQGRTSRQGLEPGTVKAQPCTGSEGAQVECAGHVAVDNLCLASSCGTGGNHARNITGDEFQSVQAGAAQDQRTLETAPVHPHRNADTGIGQIQRPDNPGTPQVQPRRLTTFRRRSGEQQRPHGIRPDLADIAPPSTTVLPPHVLLVGGPVVRRTGGRRHLSGPLRSGPAAGVEGWGGATRCSPAACPSTGQEARIFTVNWPSSAASSPFSTTARKCSAGSVTLSRYSRM